MDYVLGSVAALISGNITPNRPRILKRATTPIKKQPSPNITPKSECVLDRSIYLSPTIQKKKELLKKSPKRIFQNVDLDVANEDESNANLKSPKFDNVKKHLQKDLDADDAVKNNTNTRKSLDKKRSKSAASLTPKEQVNSKGYNKNVVIENMTTANVKCNEGSPIKKNKKHKLNSDESFVETPDENADQESAEKGNSINNKKKKKNKLKSDISQDETEDNSKQNVFEKSPKKGKKKQEPDTENVQIKTEGGINEENEKEPTDCDKNENTLINKRKHKKKVQNNQTNKINNNKLSQGNQADIIVPIKQSKKIKPKGKQENYVNPNAITNKDTDSEHESDNDIESETEENNKEVLEAEQAEGSSDEEEESRKQEKVEKKEQWINTGEEKKRTLFVGNVPFNKKCKKEIKRIFNKHGHIESVRIRNVPVKDPSVDPKLAVIKNELHPERSTVNVYIKYSDPLSVEKALVENNVELNGNNLRVSKSDSTGAEHDPKCSVFIGNMPFALEDNTLRTTFEKCGEIVSVRIIRDRKTNAGKGFGYVNFASKDGVELALALPDEDLTIKNRIMRVKRCTQLTPKSGKNQNHSWKQGLQRNQGNNRGFQGNNRGFQGKNEGFRGNNRGFQGRNEGFQGRNQRNSYFDQKQGQSDDVKGDGAYRRITNKRKNQDGGDGPPNKRGRDLNQPIREKKIRKEFVGVTAEKRKKHKFNKGSQKKKALGEILTK